ncbi:MAG: TetR/AcrR family transcriptional regulator [Oscillospiraceae bacterium]|nr:TetR/AcrR family transcriptional regulator [Oscillospiraceae bacterium]
MKKQPERTAMTRSILIDTFLKLSKEKPLDKITVSEICTKAGYNRSTFYQYFNDTNHLLSGIGDDLLLYIKDTVINQVGKAPPERYFIESFIYIHEEKRDILKLLLGDRANSFSSKLKETMIPLFARQMQMPMDDEQTVYKLDFYLSGIISMLSRWVTSEPTMPPEQYALITRQIVEGMRNSGLFPAL